MYRFGWLFEQLEINLSINLLWTTLFRNLLVRRCLRRPTATGPADENTHVSVLLA